MIDDRLTAESHRWARPLWAERRETGLGQVARRAEFVAPRRNLLLEARTVVSRMAYFINPNNSE